MKERFLTEEESKQLTDYVIAILGNEIPELTYACIIAKKIVSKIENLLDWKIPQSPPEKED